MLSWEIPMCMENFKKIHSRYINESIFSVTTDSNCINKFFHSQHFFLFRLNNLTEERSWNQMECGQERRKHFSLGPRAKQQQQAAFTDAMGRDARVDKCCSDRYLSVQIRVQNSPLSLRRRELRVLLLADVKSNLKK